MKNWLYKALGALFFLGMGFLPSTPASASTALIVDDFEAYSDGYLFTVAPAQWTGSSYWSVDTSRRHSGAKAITWPGFLAARYLFSTPTAANSDGYLDWWVYLQDFSGTHNYVLSFIPDGGGPADFALMLDANSGSPRMCTAALTDCISVNTGEWFNARVEWTATQYRFSPNAGITWSAWLATTYSDVASISGDSSSFTGMVLFFDDFGTGVPPVISGVNPIITPTQPLDATTTVVDFANIAVSGSVQIPTANTYIWDSLMVYFNRMDGIGGKAIPITLPDLVAGQSYNYSATTSLILPEYASSTFRVFYVVSGKESVAPWTPIDIEHSNNAYIMQSGAVNIGGFPLVGVDVWTPPTLEDCTDPSLSVLEAITCRIQNTLLGLVIPQASSVNNLIGTFRGISTKFPFSYVSAIAATLQNISAGINESASIPIKVFGQSGNLSLAFWSATTTIAGISTTIGAAIKLLLTFALILIFLFWGIGYLHRIL